MNIVLLSGGSGKRLWPLSNEVRSKQFLKLLKTQDGERCSMVQRVFWQIKQAQLPAQVTIATSRMQLGAIRNQLGEQVDIVLEPERRNTYPAILLSCAHLYFNRGMDQNDVVVVLPVDPYADIAYFENLALLERAALQPTLDLVLMGVNPVFPSEKYGYIIPAGPALAKSWQDVTAFKEKPDLAQAQALIRRGALWNCGVFAFRLRFAMDMLRRLLPECDSFEDVLQRYDDLPSDSFDYEVVERARAIGVVRYDGDWKDLGTWNTLTEEIEDRAVGRVLLDSTNDNTHVINELNIPMVVMGTHDLIIAASHDGVLISDKHQSSFMKPLVDQIQQRPMYEERRWGEYSVLDYSRPATGMQSLTRRLSVRAGQAISYHTHHFRKEIWTITAGRGEFVLNGKRKAVAQGDVLIIPMGMAHSIRAIEDLQFIEIQIGEVLEDGDVDRGEMEW